MSPDGNTWCVTDDKELPGGTITPIVRVSNTVRRATRASSPCVHALLQHLERVGFDGSPRFLGIDEQGREILSFIEGDVTALSSPSGMFSDDALVAAANLLRHFHDSTAAFVAGHLDGWQFQVGAPIVGDVVCHNDLGPYNTIYRDGAPIAFVDWDFAAPAPREWDIAYALWRFVPLYDNAQCERLGWSTDPRGPRIRKFLDAYGLEKHCDILDVVAHRQDVMRITIETWSREGDPAFVNLVKEGRVEEITDNMEYLKRSANEWKAFL